MCVCVLKVIYLQASGVMYLFSDSTCESFLLLFFFTVLPGLIPAL